MRRAFLPILALAAALSARADLAGPFDFETAGQFSANFQTPVNVSGTRVLAQTNNGAANDTLSLEETTAGVQAVTALYDTTPAETTAGTATTIAAPQFEVAFTLTGAASGSSFGVHLVDAANPANNTLALFNLFTGVNDQIRFFRDGTLGTGGAGTQVGNLLGDAGADPGGPPLNFLLSVNQTGAIPQMTLTVGTLSLSSTFNASDLILNPQIGLRLFDSSGAVGGISVDDFRITVVPEPAALPLLALLAGARLLRRARN